MHPTRKLLLCCGHSLGLAILTLSLGCTRGTSEQTASASGTADQPPVQTIAIVYYACDDPFSTAVRAGAEAAAEQLEQQLEWHLPALGDVQSQRERFEQAVKSRVAGICVCPFSPSALTDALAAARQANIPVVAFERPADPGAGVVSYAGTDYFHCGRILVEGIAAAHPDGCQVLVLRHADDHPGSTQRRQGMIMTASDEQGVQLILSDGTLAGLGEAAKTKLIQQWLASNEESQAVCALTASDTVAAVKAVQQHDAEPPLKVYGFGATEQTAVLVQDKQLAAAVLEDPYMMGYWAVTALAQHLSATEEAPGEMIVTGEHFVDAQSATSADNQRRLETNVRAVIEN